MLHQLIYINISSSIRNDFANPIAKKWIFVIYQLKRLVDTDVIGMVILLTASTVIWTGFKVISLFLPLCFTFSFKLETLTACPAFSDISSFSSSATCSGSDPSVGKQISTTSSDKEMALSTCLLIVFPVVDS